MRNNQYRGVEPSNADGGVALSVNSHYAAAARTLMLDSGKFSSSFRWFFG
jgi:hypothetical protein